MNVDASAAGLSAVPMSERALQDAVIELAQWRGWLVYHTHDSRRSQAGFPDLCMVREGRLVFAELKSAKGKVSAAQRVWLDALESATVENYVWRPEHWSSGLIERRLA